MVEYFNSFLLGIIEGLTEFLPVSSTAHLIVAEYLLDIKPSKFYNFFTIFIQLGAISAVPILYFKRLTRGFNLYKYLVTSFIPAVFFGLLLDDFLESIFQGYYIIALSWILGGVILIFIDTWIKDDLQNSDIEDLNYKQSFKIGLFQCLAMFPGISRSGASIIGGRIVGLNHTSAVEYSFLLGIPTILGASAKKMIDYRDEISSYMFSNQSIILFVGFSVSFIIAFFTIKWMVTLVQKYGFKYFGYYRVIIGLVFLAVLFWK